MTWDQKTATLAAAIVGPVCALVGVFLGNYLTRSSQREQWRLDRRTEEYRELLRAMATVFTNKQRFGTGGTGDRQFNIELEQANVESLRVLRDRIIIAPELADANILTRWHLALDHADGYRGTTNWKAFADEYTTLTETLVQMALAPPPSRWRRAFRRLARPFNKVKLPPRPREATDAATVK